MPASKVYSSMSSTDLHEKVEVARTEEKILKIRIHRNMELHE